MTNHPHRNSERVTIKNLRGDHERVTLPPPHFEKRGGREDLTGTWIEALYAGARTGRHFVQIYSIWDDGTGRIVGTVYRELDVEEYLDYCRSVGCEPVGVEATEV